MDGGAACNSLEVYTVIARSDQTRLILKRSSLVHTGFDDYDVLCGDKLVGRIYHDRTSRSEKPWFWTLAYGYYKDRTPTHGNEVCRETAVAAFAARWRRE